MTLKLISPEPPKKPKRMISAKQLGGVESPATVLLHPVHLEGPVQWWSYDKILLGGIRVNGVDKIEGGARSDAILYMPTPIPRSWGEKEFSAVVEYECDDAGAIFQFRLHYGCGDPSELHRGESGYIKGQVGSKQRCRFKLNEQFLARNELLRCTLEIERVSPKPVYVYGAWLEVGV